MNLEPQVSSVEKRHNHKMLFSRGEVKEAMKPSEVKVRLRRDGSTKLSSVFELTLLNEHIIVTLVCCYCKFQKRCT